MLRALLALVLVLATSLASAQELMQYAFTPTDAANLQSYNLTKYKNKGVTARWRWATLNPKSGVYDWTLSDSAVAQAKAAGKTMLIAVYTGPNSPRWVAKDHWFNYKWQDHTNSMPDPTLTWADWEKFLTEFGKRYNGNPIITGVHLTGPTNESAEYHMPPSLRTTPGYTDARFLDAWKRSITKYNEVFPDKVLVSNISQVFQQNDGLREKIAAMAVSIVPKERLWFQHDHIHNGTPINEKDTALVRSYGAKGYKTGFEFVGGENQQSFDQLIIKIKSYGAKYAQTYQGQKVGQR